MPMQYTTTAALLASGTGRLQAFLMKITPNASRCEQVQLDFLFR